MLFRKRRIGEGEFCGPQLGKDEDLSIPLSQDKFANGTETPGPDRAAPEEEELDRKEVLECRRSLGEGNWLLSPTRPDLSLQVHVAQHQIGCPTVSAQRTGGARASEWLLSRQQPASQREAGSRGIRSGDRRDASQRGRARGGT